jgi:hypothetical protein
VLLTAGRTVRRLVWCCRDVVGTWRRLVAVDARIDAKGLNDGLKGLVVGSLEARLAEGGSRVVVVGAPVAFDGSLEAVALVGGLRRLVGAVDSLDGL